MNSGWTRSESPFHAGEQAVQTRMGVREKMETFGRKVIRDHMPDQHRNFFSRLPFLIVGTTDAQGRPWASILTGPPGFITAPNPRQLQIATQPLFGSPLADNLRVGADIGILGILPANRRRNRLTGHISAVNAAGITISILQSFGNCPQYIQTREVEVLPTIHSPQQAREITGGDGLDDTARTLISQADTLFIATSHTAQDNNPASGSDASHRGGKPGFVQLEDDRTVVFPDFTGNFYYNTVGNILMTAKAGMTFVDFDTGDLLYLTGQASIVWDGPEVEAFQGAERLIRVQVDSWRRVAFSLPLRFQFGEYSPFLDRTGSWDAVAAVNPSTATDIDPS
ncbi:MAG: pyridoxamine 5'-phosphate oxidase family protein [Elainellaceae cyanobacterium]